MPAAADRKQVGFRLSTPQQARLAWIVKQRSDAKGEPISRNEAVVLLINEEYERAGGPARPRKKT